MHIIASQLQLSSTDLQSSTQTTVASGSTSLADAFMSELAAATNALQTDEHANRVDALLDELKRLTDRTSVQTLLDLLHPLAKMDDPQTRLLRLLLGSDQDTAQPRGQGTGLRLIWQTSEATQFAASGKVCLADGSEVRFATGFTLATTQQSSLELNTRWRDPLLLDLGPGQGQLSAVGSTSIDLTGDGIAETLPGTGVDAGWLFNDANGNGTLDDRSELFGPRTGSGFGELSTLDQDGNGWVDAADPAFAQLRLWRSPTDGNLGSGAPIKHTSLSLADAGVGALAVQSADTRFTFGGNGQPDAQLRASSVWLGENGQVGTVRELNLPTRT